MSEQIDNIIRYYKEETRADTAEEAAAAHQKLVNELCSGDFDDNARAMRYAIKWGKPTTELSMGNHPQASGAYVTGISFGRNTNITSVSAYDCNKEDDYYLTLSPEDLHHEFGQFMD